MKRPVNSCYDLEPLASGREFGVLSSDDFSAFVGLEIFRARVYDEDNFSVSETQEGKEHKRQMMNRLDTAIIHEASDEMRALWHGGRNGRVPLRTRFLENLESPASLRFFEFFDVPNSPLAISFFGYTWDYAHLPASEFFHANAPYFTAVGPDGESLSADTNDPWMTLLNHDAFSISQRLNASAVAAAIRECTSRIGEIPSVLFVKGDALSERFYGLVPCKIRWFTTNLYPKPANMFPKTGCVNIYNRQHIQIIPEDFVLNMYYPNLMHNMDIVVAHNALGDGFFEDYDKKLLSLFVTALDYLKTGGKLIFDITCMTDSSDRWFYLGYYPVFRSKSGFLSQGNCVAEAVKLVSDRVGHLDDVKLGGSSFEISKIEPRLIRPWGVQSVYFELTKV